MKKTVHRGWFRLHNNRGVPAVLLDEKKGHYRDMPMWYIEIKGSGKENKIIACYTPEMLLGWYLVATTSIHTTVVHVMQDKSGFEVLTKLEKVHGAQSSFALDVGSATYSKVCDWLDHLQKVAHQEFKLNFPHRA